MKMFETDISVWWEKKAHQTDLTIEAYDTGEITIELDNGDGCFSHQLTLEEFRTIAHMIDQRQRRLV